MEYHFRHYYDYDENIECKDYLPEHEFTQEILIDAIARPNPLMITWRGCKIPVFYYFDHRDTREKLSFDPFINGFIFLSGLQEIVIRERDEHNRFMSSSSLQDKYNVLSIPVVNIYFELLAEKISSSGIKIKRKEAGPDATSLIEITHDIDRLHCGWIEKIGLGIKNPSIRSFSFIFSGLFNKLFRKNDFYYEALLKLLSFEKQHGIQSIFFFLASKSKEDSDYLINKKNISFLFGAIKDSQSVIGLHAGYDTWNNGAEFSRQFNFLKSNCDITQNINRQHFLRFDIEITPKIWESNGIDYDYTLGFADNYGFRNGICGPFHLYDFENQTSYRCTQIPLYFFDSHLFKNRKTFNEGKLLSDLTFIRNNFNYRFSVLFHNTVFVKLKYEDALPLFEKIVEIFLTKHD